jgi:hypothetical protein
VHSDREPHTVKFIAPSPQTLLSKPKGQPMPIHTMNVHGGGG